MADTRRGASQRFIVLGFPRSGTTLLAQLLDAHPDISCPPETHLFSAAGRFLAEQAGVEGPPIGVLSGLSFLDIPPDDVMAALREMVFAFHDRIAGDAPLWVEKTATDIFHLEALEPMLAGHARFIVVVRHPLDVIASNMDLAMTMGAQLPELFAVTRGVNGPFDGFAKAWVDRMEALAGFVERNRDACFVVNYEELLANPAERLNALFEFMGVAADGQGVIDTAFSRPGRLGLGDFRTHETDGIRPPTKDGWRKRLPHAAVARILPLLAPMMERYGYTPPKVPRLLSREEAIRQFVMAARMKRSARGAAPTPAP